VVGEEEKRALAATRLELLAEAPEGAALDPFEAEQRGDPAAGASGGGGKKGKKGGKKGGKSGGRRA
jgi:hypothetical protein